MLNSSESIGSNENIPNKYTNTPDTFISIDLEMNKPVGEIIEIGACIFSKTKGVLKTENWIIKTEFSLSTDIISLTGITESLITREGISLQDGYKNLIKFRDSYSAFINPVVWGHGDIEVLQNQSGFFGDFGRRVIDVKTLEVFDRIKQNKPVSGGLAKTLNRHGMTFVGKKHRAGPDAENTARLFLEFLRKD